ncbi:MAG: NAD-dependent deacetylase [Acidimicrobiia bacterium]
MSAETPSSQRYPGGTQFADPSILTAAEWVANATALVVFTGAGVSTESGIPDFRGPQGIWKKIDPSIFEFSRYVRDPEIRKLSWRMRLEHGAFEARPNPSHYAIAELEKLTSFEALITQNIDGLHHAAGSTPEKIYEIHGTMKQVKCLDCGRRWPTEVILERVTKGQEDPSCTSCGGILKTATISFGEQLESHTLDKCQEAAVRSDVFLVAGSSLVVYPAAALPQIARDTGAKLLIFNLEETPLDSEADLVFRGKTGELLPRLVEAVKSVQ